MSVKKKRNTFLIPNSDFEHCSQTKYSTANSTAASNERSLKSKYTVQNGMMDIACVVADNIYS